MVRPLGFAPALQSAGARRLLEEAGFKPNAEGWLEKDGKVFEFNLITNTNPQRKNIMTVAQNAWKKIGVKCNTQNFEWAVFLKDFVNKGEVRCPGARLEHDAARPQSLPALPFEPDRTRAAQFRRL